MKTQIRQSVFETNSSSTHAICITTKNVNINNLPKSIYFAHGDYGWEGKVYTDIASKAAYLNEAIHAFFDGAEVEVKQSEIADILSRYNVSAEFANDDYSQGYYDSGYIDHGEDVGQFVFAVLEDEQKLLNYLFGDSIVVTGNDNGDWFMKYMYKDPDKYNYTYKDEFSIYEIYEKGN